MKDVKLLYNELPVLLIYTPNTLVCAYDVTYGTLANVLNNEKLKLSLLHIRHISAEIICGILELIKLGIDIKILRPENVAFSCYGMLKITAFDVTSSLGESIFIISISMIYIFVFYAIFIFCYIQSNSLLFSFQ